MHSESLVNITSVIESQMIMPILATVAQPFDTRVACYADLVLGDSIRRGRAMNDYSKRLKHRATLAICGYCMIAHANGDTSGWADSGDPRYEPLQLIDFERYEMTLGLIAEDHNEECEVFKAGSHVLDDGCDCENQGYRAIGCDACGNPSHGDKYAATLVPRKLPVRKAWHVAEIGDLVKTHLGLLTVDHVETFPKLLGSDALWYSEEQCKRRRCGIPDNSSRAYRRVIVTGVESRIFEMREFGTPIGVQPECMDYWRIERIEADAAEARAVIASGEFK